MPCTRSDPTFFSLSVIRVDTAYLTWILFFFFHYVKAGEASSRPLDRVASSTTASEACRALFLSTGYFLTPHTLHAVLAATDVVVTVPLCSES